MFWCLFFSPTKAIAPILLEDMRKVAVERKGETNFFTSQNIKDCMKKVIAVNLHQVSQPPFLFFSFSTGNVVLVDLALLTARCKAIVAKCAHFQPAPRLEPMPAPSANCLVLVSFPWLCQCLPSLISTQLASTGRPQISLGTL